VRSAGAARALVALASVALVLALVAGYARHAVVDSAQFANRATVALSDDNVKSLVADKITDDVVLENQRDLLTARPIIQSVASAIVGSRAFTSLFRSAVRDVHRAVFARDQHTVTLTVADVGTVLAAALEQVRPSLASKVEATGRVELVKRNIGDASASAVQIADTVKVLALLLALVAVALAAGAIAISPRRRHTIVELGIAVAIAGVVVVVLVGVARSIAVDQVEAAEDRAAVGAVFDAFLGDLRALGWIVAGSGAVVAAAAASLIRPIDLGEPLRRAWAWLATEPQRPVWRVVRGAGLVLLGVVVLLEHDAVLQLVLTAVGVYLVYEGISALLRLIYRPSVEEEEVERPRRRAAAWLQRRRALVTAAIAAIAVVGALATFLGTGGTTTAAPPTGACNGHVQLCDRPLAQVALPATHNSMSVPLPGWYASEQERPIADQLRDGIRGLLIDSHYADKLSNGRLRTDFGSHAQLVAQAKQDGVSDDAVDAAIRIRERVGFSGKGTRGMYLCHTFCELGGTKLGSVLDDIHDFLVSHPGDVLVVINQDYVTPADFVKAADAAGLGDLVYGGPITDTEPTLREMIDANRRLVFLAENHAGGAPWYRPAYRSITEETPYQFTKVSQLTDPENLPATCKANRGPARAPLFLVNHWIATAPLPRPSDAAKVNAYRPLLARLRECQRLRHHLPNLVAVNFYRTGDLLKAVDALNGIT
jgi:MFS family permease